jgi:hypothetical protein
MRRGEGELGWGQSNQLPSKTSLSGMNPGISSVCARGLNFSMKSHIPARDPTASPNSAHGQGQAKRLPPIAGPLVMCSGLWL